MLWSVCTYVNVCAYVYLQCDCANMHVHVCICGAFAHAYMPRGWVCVRFKGACRHNACVHPCGVWVHKQVCVGTSPHTAFADTHVHRKGLVLPASASLSVSLEHPTGRA